MFLQDNYTMNSTASFHWCSSSPFIKNRIVYINIIPRIVSTNHMQFFIKTCDWVACFIQCYVIRVPSTGVWCFGLNWQHADTEKLFQHPLCTRFRHTLQHHLLCTLQKPSYVHLEICLRSLTVELTVVAAEMVGKYLLSNKMFCIISSCVRKSSDLVIATKFSQLHVTATCFSDWQLYWQANDSKARKSDALVFKLGMIK